MYFIWDDTTCTKAVTNDPYKPEVLLWVSLQKHTSVRGIPRP